MKQETIPRSGELYRHFKGNLYQIITVATHTETRERLVIYQALYGDYKTYARPLDMFLSEVDYEKYKDVKAQFRFEKVNPEDLTAKISETGMKKESVDTKEKTEQKEKESETENAGIEEKEPVTDNIEENTDGAKEVVNKDLLDFLDAESYEEKLEILYSMRRRVDEQLITNIEMSLDISGQTGTIEERINFVKNNLQTRARFESNRLR